MKSRNIMSYNEAVDFLNRLGQFSYDFDLARIKKILKYFGNPQDKIMTVHIAGTNGKGSVCAFISSILQEAGFKTGLYTSPHLTDVRERIRINNKKISKSDFAYFITRYSLLITRCRLTYFELLTAMAFRHFHKENVGFAVIETGLGGRLDATNVIKMPAVSVITNIGLEHTRYLGNTVRKIASEKAGIIKKNVAVITGADGAALAVIKDIAGSKNAPVLKNPPSAEKCCLSLAGAFQQKNARLAAACCRYLKIPEKFIVAGLKKTYWPGRFEFKKVSYRGKKFTLLLDGAHNPAGITALRDSITEYFGMRRKIDFVFGVLKDKDYKAMVEIISPVVGKVFVSSPETSRALKPEKAACEFQKYVGRKKVFLSESIKTATENAFERSKCRTICITGSLYTVAEGMKCLKI